jgi:sugar lactone lactonase YvrE
MKHTRILFLIALVAGLGLTPGWELTSAAQTCQQEGACFVFESQGYITDPSTGQTTIAFRVTNKCRNPVAYVAIGTGGFTRVAPGDGSVYNGDICRYDVSWARAGGGGFESIKFTPTLKNFANSASDVFSVVVSNFNPATTVMVRGKAGSAQETYNFLLSQTCGTPTPTRRIYWTNVGTNTIGRANLNGQNVNQSFISGARSPFGMAVGNNHIYWANPGTNAIGRADLDGQNVNQSFITASYPEWVAVDSRYIYWTDAGTSTIGRADLDGQNVNQNFIITASGSFGLAVDSSHIYWANVNPETIGRADLDGQNVNQNFIVPGQVGLYGLAVDSSYIYWADIGSNRIGRADLDGQNVNLTFISVPSSGPRGVAVDRSHIYWTNSFPGTLGQADLDGQNVNQNFITGGSGSYGIAVDPE